MDSKKERALFTFHYGAENMGKIEELGFEVIYADEGTLEMKDKYKDIDVLVCYDPFKKIDITQMLNLKWIQLVSKGINHVPVDLVKKQNILITNNTQATSIPIAEWIVTFLLQIFKQSKYFQRNQDDRIWKANKDILEVYGKKIGFLGTGNIAKAAAKRLKAFDAILYGVNEIDEQAEHFDKCFGLEEIDKLYESCDAIISTLPNTPQTFHMLNEAAFNKMKDGVALINVSRGSVIDTGALIMKIKEGKFRGVALDVFEQEPLPADSELWGFDNVIITPHNVLWSDLYDQRVFEAVYANLKKYKSNEQLDNVVDFERGY